MVQHLIKLVNYLVLIKILFVQIADVQNYLKLNNFAFINNILESNYLDDNSVPRHFSSKTLESTIKHKINMNLKSFGCFKFV